MELKTAIRKAENRKLRDKFAIAIGAALIQVDYAAWRSGKINEVMEPEDYAELTYSYASAMLEESEEYIAAEEYLDQPIDEKD